MFPDQQRRCLEADPLHSRHIVCSITGQSQQVYKLHGQTQHPVKAPGLPWLRNADMLLVSSGTALETALETGPEDSSGDGLSACSLQRSML